MGPCGPIAHAAVLCCLFFGCARDEAVEAQPSDAGADTARDTVDTELLDDTADNTDVADSGPGEARLSARL